MCTYMQACIYVCLFVHMYTYIYKHTYVYTYVALSKHMRLDCHKDEVSHVHMHARLRARWWGYALEAKYI